MSATAVYDGRVQMPRARVPWAGRRGITVAQLLARAHEDVQARGVADCPVCGGALRPAGGDAECSTCGSRLG